MEPIVIGGWSKFVMREMQRGLKEIDRSQASLRG